MSLSITLHKPIAVGKKTVTELTLRDITGTDALNIGLPYLLISKDDPHVVGLEFRTNVLIAYISRLAGIPKESVKQLSMRDLSSLQAYIHSFFGDDIKGNSHG